MSTLFFIGNGFDLNCGMRTKYTHAYEDYFKTSSESAIIAKFKEDIDGNIRTWGDFELSMAKYASNFSNEVQFLDCLYDFQDFLGVYLRQEEEKFWKRVNDTNSRIVIAKEFFSSLTSFYSKNSNNITDLMQKRGVSQIGDMRFVSFNYTRVFDEILRLAYSNRGMISKSVCHIHGNAEELVLGIDNESQINVQFPITVNLKTSFIKPFFNEQYDINRVETVKRYLNEVNTVCVYGMSLGLSDLMWRKALIEWLDNSEENHLFIYNYGLSTQKYRAIAERIQIEKEAKRKVFEDWEIDVSDSLFERVHMVCGVNIFNIEDAIKDKKENISENDEEMYHNAFDTYEI